MVDTPRRYRHYAAAVLASLAVIIVSAPLSGRSAAGVGVWRVGDRPWGEDDGRKRLDDRSAQCRERRDVGAETVTAGHESESRLRSHVLRWGSPAS